MIFLEPMMPLLSVVIPTRNRAAMLAATVDSVRAGGLDPEIIVVDDASTDDTVEVCAGLSGVTYLRLATQAGTAAARNRGLAVARGELVSFIDDDDLRLPDTFPQQVALLTADVDAAFCYARVLVGDSRFGLPTGGVVPDILPSGDVYWSLLERNFVPACSVVARKAAILECSGFDERLQTMEDYDLWVRLSERHRVLASPDPVAIYRRRSLTSGQKTSDRVRHGRNRRQMLRRLLDRGRARANPAQRRQAFAKHMKGVYHSLIHDALEANTDGRGDIARAYLAEARASVSVPLKGWFAWSLLRHPSQRSGSG